MTDEPEGERSVTQEELDAFAVKLQSWAKDLSDRERALLSHVLAKPGPEDDVPDDEVVGFTARIGMPRFPSIGFIGGPLPDPGPNGWARIWGQTIGPDPGPGSGSGSG